MLIHTLAGTKDLDTRFLKTFLSVTETGSIAAAARKENLTPSAVIQRMKALENEVGKPLVRRAGHLIKITEAGRSILDSAKVIVEAANDLPILANKHLDVGTIMVGAIHSMVTGLCPEILTQISSAWPGITTDISPGQSSELYAKIERGVLDVAILVEPPFTIPKSMHWIPIRHDPLILITSINEESLNPLQLLRTCPFIRYDRKHWGGRSAEAYLKRINISPRDRYELDSLEAITVLVDRGLGVSVIPDWFPPWPEGLSLKKLSLDDAPTRCIGILYQSFSPMERLIGKFSEVVRTVAHEKEQHINI